MSRGEETRERIFRYVSGRLQDGSCPSVREICRDLAIPSTSTVYHHLKRLEEEGLLQSQPGLRRSLQLVRRRPVEQVPLLGTVAAGQPILAQGRVEGYVPYAGAGAAPEELFALRVKGESMKNAGILPGDIVIVRRCPTAENGQIVVALLEEEATVKRLFWEREGVRLQPENEDFAPIYTREAVILGRVIALVREYD